MIKFFLQGTPAVYYCGSTIAALIGHGFQAADGLRSIAVA